MKPRGSWRTTGLWALGALGSCMVMVLKPLLDGDPVTVADWAGWLTITFGSGSVGLLVARDHKVSSEEAGIKP